MKCTVNSPPGKGTSWVGSRVEDQLFPEVSSFTFEKETKILNSSN
jgi:hypothetical protein